MTSVPVNRVDATLATVAVAAAIVTVVCTQFVKEQDGAIREWWLGLQIASAAVTAIAPTIAAVRARRREAHATKELDQVRLQSRLELNEAIDPIVRKLGYLSVTRTRTTAHATLRAEVMALTVTIAYKIVGPDSGTRACFFEFEAGPPKRLRPTEHHYGRMGTTRSEFVGGTADGDAAIGMVEGDHHRLCRDVRSEPPPGWNDKTRDYLTFISVPVIAGGIAYGMLTVDSLEPGDLDEDDVNVLRVLAGLLAVALEVPGGPVMS